MRSGTARCARCRHQGGIMAHWIARWRQRWWQRALIRAAVQVVADGHGLTLRTWLLTAPLTPDGQAALRREVAAWLEAQIAVAASPYGWSQCTIVLNLVQLADRRRSMLW